MPTVIFLFGWRFFFYANEGNEPMHIHCRKAEKEAKFWLDAETRAITLDFAYNMDPKDLKYCKKTIAQYFDEIEEQWNDFERQRRQP